MIVRLPCLDFSVGVTERIPQATAAAARAGEETEGVTCLLFDSKIGISIPRSGVLRAVETFLRHVWLVLALFFPRNERSVTDGVHNWMEAPPPPREGV